MSRPRSEPDSQQASGSLWVLSLSRGGPCRIREGLSVPLPASKTRQSVNPDGPPFQLCHLLSPSFQTCERGAAPPLPGTPWVHSTEARLVPASHFSGTPNPGKPRPGAGLAPRLPAPGAAAATAESELKAGRLRRQGWGWGVSSQQLGEGRRQKAAAPANCELRGGLSPPGPRPLLSAFPPFFSSSLYPPTLVGE